MKKVLLINGSPQAKGCTYTALTEVARALEEKRIETEIVHIGPSPVRGCQGCFRCETLGRCVFDDCVNEIAGKLEQADGMVLGSPVYFSSPAGEMVCFLDRLFASAGEKMSGKPCGCIVSARRAGTTAALEALQKYPLVNDQPVVGSSYWCMVFGNTPDEVRADEEGMRTMFNLGLNMAKLL